MNEQLGCIALEKGGDRIVGEQLERHLFCS